MERSKNGVESDVIRPILKYYSNRIIHLPRGQQPYLRT